MKVATEAYMFLNVEWSGVEREGDAADVEHLGRESPFHKLASGKRDKLSDETSDEDRRI